MSTLNKVFAASAVIGLNSDVKFDSIVRDAISAGILSVTDKARQVNTDGELVSLDFKQLGDETAQYIEYCAPVYCKAVLKQYSDALKAVSDATSGVELIAAQTLLNRAQSRLPVLPNGALVTNLDFVTMSGSDFKSYEHADKKILAKYRDDKRGILRMNYRRLVEAAHNLTGKKQSKPETYAELLARFAKAITATDASGAGKHAAELSKRGINAAVLKFAFDLLQDGKLLPQAVTEASKQAKATTKRAAKQAA